ncbi:MAG: YabP/YqfC family sporulation protein [Clostridia bacterium]|nr:YabP/YqfC family sporulation protein [Clostridia bacterium]
MRLYDELFKSADGAALSRCTFIPRGGGYFQGVKAVGDFSPERIVICFPKDEVAVEGKNLSIKKYCDGDLELSGDLYSVRVLLPETGGNGVKKGRA